MNYSYFPQMPQNSYLSGRPAYSDILQQNQSYLGMKGRPVASFDEAKASMIDFDGSIFYFPDAANSRIYTKQINMDGTSSLKTYVLTDNPTPQPSPSQVSIPKNIVTKEEFDNTVKTLMDEIAKLKGVTTKHDDTSTKNNAVDLQF